MNDASSSIVPSLRLLLTRDGIEEIGRVPGASGIPDHVTIRQLPPVEDDPNPRRFYRMRIEDVR